MRYIQHDAYDGRAEAGKITFSWARRDNRMCLMQLIQHDTYNSGVEAAYSREKESWFYYAFFYLLKTTFFFFLISSILFFQKHHLFLGQVQAVLRGWVPAAGIR